jgi:hypothetical protein
MNAFLTHLSDRHEQAQEAAGEARSRLITILDEDGPALASAMADVAFLDAYARWWTTVIHHIEHAAFDPVTALSHARTAARRTLIEHPTPHLACPFAQGMAQASIEAARRFYHDTTTLDLDTITTTPHRTQPAITPSRPR